MTRKQFITEINLKAHGIVQCSVINHDGSIDRTYPSQKNLILNQGLNNVCSSTSWADQFLRCAVGTGATVTSAASGGGVTGAGAVTTFTNTTPGTFNWTTNSSVGDMIKLTSGASSGTEVRITAVNSVDDVSYTPSGTISVGEFSVYKTSQTGLTTETDRFSNYLSGVGNCGGSLAGSVVSLKRTFDQVTPPGAVTYNELGFSNAAGAGSNLFSRIKLASGVPLTAGQLLRVVYTLNITITPAASTPVTFSITNWPVLPSTSLDGDQGVIQPGLEGVNTSGATQVGGYDGSRDGQNVLEPYTVTNHQIFISPSSGAVDTFAGTNVNRTTNMTSRNATLSTYAALNFFRDKATTFLVGEANRTDFRSIGIGSLANSKTVGNTGNAVVGVFDESQTKDSLHTLTLTWRISVGRVLA